MAKYVAVNLLLALTLLIIGCARHTADRKPGAAVDVGGDFDVLFEDVIADLKKVNPLGIPTIFSTGTWVSYVLPQRAEHVLECGPAALERLEALRKVGAAHGLVAEACIAIIKGQPVQRSSPSTEPRSGVVLITYGIRR